MRLFFADMVDAIDLKKEDRRLQQVQWAESRTVRMAAPAPAVEPAVSGTEQAIEAADKLYASRDLDKAREAYMALTRQAEPITALRPRCSGLLLPPAGALHRRIAHEHHLLLGAGPVDHVVLHVLGPVGQGRLLRRHDIAREHDAFGFDNL